MGLGDETMAASILGGGSWQKRLVWSSTRYPPTLPKSAGESLIYFARLG